MSYTQVFGGTTIYPSDVSYLPLTLDADKALQWPLESNDPTNPAARIIDVTTTGSYAVTLPDATQTGAGQTILFNNLTASSNSFTVKNASGGTIATVGVGEQWQVYLSDTATAAGTWRVFRYGASTATVQASALAGYGLTVTSNTLSQSMAVTTFNSSPRTVLLTDRSSALVWNGTGSATLNLPSAGSAANNFFIGVRNGGGGDLTVAAAGSDTIDGAATLTLSPGDSANVLTDGVRWYTLGLGQDAVFAFDYTSIPVTGGTYTLAGSELNRIAYKFQGALLADQYIVVPATIQQYWVDNATTGAFSLFLRTSGGTPVSVVQGGRGIYYCNGANVLDADTATISLPVSATDGGTGNTSYAVGDLLYANTPTSLAKLSDVAVGNALISGGVGSAPLWGKIGLTTHVSGTLPVANGGTGVTTSTGSGAVVLATSPTLVTPVLGAASATSISNGLGAVGTPSYSFTGDANTGMWSPGVDTLAFSEGGVEAMRIDSSGNVGIGTSTPEGRLDLNGAQITRGDNNGYVFFAPKIGTTPFGTDYDRFEIRVDPTAQLTLMGNTHGGTGVARALGFMAGNSERMRVNTDGNVGIGTTATPQSKMEIRGTASGLTFNALTLSNYVGFTAGTAVALYFDPNGAGTLARAASIRSTQVSAANVADLRFFTANSDTPAERMQIDAAGNVLIGTPSLATTAVEGFPYIPTCAGVPTGTPTGKTGFAPMVVDSTNNKLYVYIGGAWRIMN